jgi:hypothetical protein
VDLELVRLWSAYQRDEPHPTWDSFLAMLTQANASLLHEIRHTEGLLTSSRRQGDFVP